jgi:hypothetical protein
VIAGNREQRLGKIQAAYGIATQADENRLAEWLSRRHKADPIHK